MKSPNSWTSCEFYRAFHRIYCFCSCLVPHCCCQFTLGGLTVGAYGVRRARFQRLYPRDTGIVSRFPGSSRPGYCCWVSARLPGRSVAVSPLQPNPCWLPGWLGWDAALSRCLRPYLSKPRWRASRQSRFERCHELSEMSITSRIERLLLG